MAKLLFVGIFLIFVTICSASLDRLGNDDRMDIKDVSRVLSFREKRSLLFSLSALSRAGVRAIGDLLGRARQVWQTYNSRLFQKIGDYRTAVKDFEALKPKDVKLHHDAFNKLVGREGRVADRVVKVKKQGYQNNPTLYIIKAPKNGKGPAKLDMIVYKKKTQRQSEPAIQLDSLL